MTTHRLDLSNALLGERRQALLDAVRVVGPDHFDMNDWARNVDKRCLTPREVDAFVGDVSDMGCGTAVCLAGTAVALTGWLPEYNVDPADDQWGGSANGVAKYFGLDPRVFFTEAWEEVHMSTGETLWDLVRPADPTLSTRQEAEWWAVQLYLTDLINDGPREPVRFDASGDPI